MPVGPGQFFVRILSRAIKRWISRPNGPPGLWPLLRDGPVMRNLPHPSPETCRVLSFWLHSERRIRCPSRGRQNLSGSRILASVFALKHLDNTSATKEALCSAQTET